MDLGTGCVIGLERQKDVNEQKKILGESKTRIVAAQTSHKARGKDMAISSHLRSC